MKIKRLTIFILIFSLTFLSVIYIDTKISIMLSAIKINKKFNNKLKELSIYKNDRKNLNRKTLKEAIEIRRAVDVSTLKNKPLSENIELKTARLQNNTNDSNSLKEAWVLDLGQDEVIQSSPFMCNNSLIVTTPSGKLFSIELSSGKINWKKNHNQLAPFSRRGAMCESLANGKEIIFAQSGRGIACINSENGNIAADICANGMLGEGYSAATPIFSDGSLYAAFINPSYISSFNVQNGAENWRYLLSKENGSNVWSGMSIFDNKIVFNTGSPENWADLPVDSEKFKNSSSVIALERFSGNKLWQFQEKNMDLWDHDFVGKPLRDSVGKKIITFSKSGKIYFLNEDTGVATRAVKNETLIYGDLNISIKKIINGINLNPENFELAKLSLPTGNLAIYGLVPPLMKKIRIFDGYSGGPQWPGGVIDSSTNLLLVPSNRGLYVGHYYDFIPTLKKDYYSSQDLSSCTSCHSKEGAVIRKNDKFIPSLLFTTYLYSENQLKDYLKKDAAHKKVKENSTFSIFLALKEVDDLIQKNGLFSVHHDFVFDFHMGLNQLLSKGPFGLLSAISLKTEKIVWSHPSGSYYIKDRIHLGSPSYAGMANIDNTGMSVFTGSFDKKVYLLRNADGKIIGENTMKASGSAIPKVIKIDKTFYILIISSGGKLPGDSGSKVYAYKLTEN